MASKVDRFLTGVGVGCALVALTVLAFSVVCGQHNQYCGSSLQWWQALLLGSEIVLPIVVFMTRKGV